MKTVPKQTLSVISNVATGALLLTAAVMPFLAFPIGDNLFVSGKVIATFIVALLVMIAWATQLFFRRAVQFTISPFFLPLLGILAITLVSSVISPGQPLMHIMGFGGWLMSFALIGVLAPSIIKERQAKKVVTALGFAALVISTASFLELAGVGPSKLMSLILKTPVTNNSLNLAGSPMIAFQFLAIVIVGFVAAIKMQAKEGKKASLPLVALSVTFLAGLLANGYGVFQLIRNNTFGMPYQASWLVAIETFKTVRSSLFGIGPSNYGHAYMQFKPAFMNVTPFWDLQFNYASNLPLTLASTIGLLGVIAWVVLMVQMIRAWMKSGETGKVLGAMAITAGATQLLFPPNIIIMGVQAILLAFWVAQDRNIAKDVQLHTFTVQTVRSGDDTQRLPQNTNVMVYLFTAINVLAIVFAGYWLTRFTISQGYFFASSVQAARRDVAQVYEMQRKAIVFFPYSDSYHRSYSATNMAIALALSNQKDLSDKDRQQVITLVQQSIREGKVATTLAPTNSVNWVNLARIYTNLIGTAQGSENWAMSAYSQASNTAPTDAALNLEIGGLLYRLKQFDQAASVFEKTTTLKPDWANAYYNLASARRQANQAEQALAAYQRTLNLIQDKPEDLKKLQDEVNAYQKELAASASAAKKTGTTTQTKAATPSAALTAPNASPSSQFTGQTQEELNKAPLEGP